MVRRTEEELEIGGEVSDVSLSSDVGVAEEIKKKLDTLFSVCRQELHREDGKDVHVPGTDDTLVERPLVASDGVRSKRLASRRSRSGSTPTSTHTRPDQPSRPINTT